MNNVTYNSFHPLDKASLIHSHVLEHTTARSRLWSQSGKAVLLQAIITGLLGKQLMLPNFILPTPSKNLNKNTRTHIHCLYI